MALGGGIIKIYQNKKIGYTIKKVTDSKYQLCRILKEYNREKDAKEDLIDLLSKSKKEEDL